MTRTAIAIAIGASAVILTILFSSIAFSVDNHEIELWEQIDAQQANCKLVHDKMKKIIFETAKLKDDASDDFERIYEKLMKAGRGEGGNEMLMLMNGHSTAPAPEFLKLTEKVMQNVEHFRSELAAEEKKLLDFNAERNKYVQKTPNKYFIARKEKYPVKVVTSASTNNAFATGEDNESALPERKR